MYVSRNVCLLLAEEYNIKEHTYKMFASCKDKQKIKGTDSQDIILLLTEEYNIKGTNLQDFRLLLGPAEP